MVELIVASAMNRIVSAARLKTCKLWPGSILELSFKYGGITLRLLAEQASIKMKCDDLTPAEQEWLAAMLATLADNGVVPTNPQVS